MPLIKVMIPMMRMGQRTSIGRAKLQPLTKPRHKPEKPIPML